MASNVTLLHVSPPVRHAPIVQAMPPRVRCDWHPMHASSLLAPDWVYSLELPTPPRLASGDRAALEALLGELGFQARATYLVDGDPWPAELPLLGYVHPSTTASGATVAPVLRPSIPMVAARGVWVGSPTRLGQIGLDPRALVMRHEPLMLVPRAESGGTYLVGSGLWISADGQAMGSSPSEVAAKRAQ
jgi:hypothetical protein